MDAKQMFLLNHARAHTAAMQRGDEALLAPHLGADVEQRHLGDRLEDAALLGLSDDQIRLRPNEGQNSIAWLLWHMARSEDVAMNAIVAGRNQIIDEGGWTGQLNIDARHVGAGMDDAEVSDFCNRVDVAALRSYRVAVGKRTREIAEAMTPDRWDEALDEGNLRRAVEDGAIGENAGWVRDFWANRTNAWFFSLVVGHNFLHIGEALSVRSQAGAPLGA